MTPLTELSDQIRVCTRCAALVRSRTRVVPGDGAETAAIMFIGEAPGYHEDQQGIPFVGPAGQFLNQLLASISLKREQVYITNVVKCRPPDNRDPLPGEVENCRPWLQSQLDIIRPRVIVTLGRHSMAQFFPGKSISKIHGTWQKKDGVTYFAMYHPAAALHQQNLRSEIEADIKKLPALLVETPVAGQEKPQQMTMF